MSGSFQQRISDVHGMPPIEASAYVAATHDNEELPSDKYMMAVLDGIENKIDPGKPLDKDIYAMTEKELGKIPKVPGSLPDSLDALEKDHKFLLIGDVFTNDLIEMYINYKRENEIKELAIRPHPVEFFLYYDT